MPLPLPRRPGQVPLLLLLLLLLETAHGFAPKPIFEQQHVRARAARPAPATCMTAAAPSPARRGMLSAAAAAVITAIGGVQQGAWAEEGTPAAAAADGRGQFTSADGSFVFEYPGDFQSYRKPLKTHKEEVNYKSPTVRGYEVGVAVDPVRINSLDEFGTAEEVGSKVVQVELGKDGCLEAKLLSTSSERVSGVPAYTIEYFVENTHYTSQFVAKVIIKAGRLYVCTGKCKAKDFDAYGAALREVVASFSVA